MQYFCQMNAIIIDDEQDARNVLRSMSEAYCPEITFLGEADGVQTGVLLIRQLKPDVVFLDIQMKDGTGFDLLDFFPNPSFYVVFSTAYDAFALKAFRYHAIDYLLKPLSLIEFMAAVDRLQWGTLVAQSPLIGSLKECYREKKLEKIAVSTSEGISLLLVEQILRMESDGSYTTFVMASGEKVIASRGLKEFEDLLPESHFCRIHQSHLIQLRQVHKFLKEDGGYVVMSNGDKIPVSRRKKDAFLKLLLD
jgi:two-component system LytT family response regulator